VNTKFKTAFLIPVAICLLVLGSFSLVSCMHQGPIFNIGNSFNQPVTVYFEGHKMGKINSGQSKIFYPSEVVTKGNTDLLVELKSNSGVVLYSRNFTWDELWALLQSVTGKPYWIGDATPTSTPTPSPTPMPTTSTQNQQPIEVVSVLDTYKTGQTVNPGGPEIEITLKNAAVEPVVSLAATLDLLSIPVASGLRRSWNYAFEVTPSNPLLSGNSIGSKVRLIGGGFGGSLPYSVTINGTLQSGATFAYTWEPPK
jgi:hypothetical protein